MNITEGDLFVGVHGRQLVRLDPSLMLEQAGEGQKRRTHIGNVKWVINIDLFRSN